MGGTEDDAPFRLRQDVSGQPLGRYFTLHELTYRGGGDSVAHRRLGCPHRPHLIVRVHSRATKRRLIDAKAHCLYGMVYPFCEYSTNVRHDARYCQFMYGTQLSVGPAGSRRHIRGKKSVGWSMYALFLVSRNSDASLDAASPTCLFRSIRELHLGSNRLTQLPDSICRLKTLRILWLDHNFIAGGKTVGQHTY